MDVTAPGLELAFAVGPAPVLGWLLRLVPRRAGHRPAWARLTDPVARVVLRGVRTRGTAGNDRREYYGATDLRRVTEPARAPGGAPTSARWRRSRPSPRFGFGSTPERPR